MFEQGFVPPRPSAFVPPPPSSLLILLIPPSSLLPPSRGAGTKSGSDTHDTDGIVDGHAYTVIDCVDNAGGTEFDLIKVRNPWGQGEFKSGKWDDDGPGWSQYPQVKEALKPVAADDGIFWVEKEEFFKYFKTIYLCAKNMTKFIEN